MTQGTLRIGRKRIQVDSLANASAAYCILRDASGKGSSGFPSGHLTINGQEYCVTYNGRVWTGQGYVQGLCAFDPYAYQAVVRS